jgi:LEA14-like dessication related protein
MPCGGGDIGLNVWVEKGEILFYLSRSGAFDENNVFPKLGRVRLKLMPNPFDGGDFRQELKLKEGYIEISGNKTIVKIWVDVFSPVVHVETESNQLVTVEATYENWRIRELEWTNQRMTNASLGFRDAPMNAVIRKDSVGFNRNQVLFYHRNRDESLFDITVHQQGLDPVKDQLWNPLKNLTFGGRMAGENMKPAGTTAGKYADTEFKGWKLKSVQPSGKNHLKVYLHIENTSSTEAWKEGLAKIEKEAITTQKTAQIKTRQWWIEFWNRSYIAINPDQPLPSSPEWQVGRNYQLFRFQLGCNAYGKYPTKFNGGLFTFDPGYVDKNLPFTPDHRNWGGGTHTAQNQRLVYFPMFKSGDFDMLPSQLNFYLQALGNAEKRTEFYWGHKGASFTEQLEQFGLPLATSYSWSRPENFPKGLEFNYWLEYLWDTQMEFCLMMLDVERYSGEDISKYIPFIESCLTFFDEHYRMEAQIRGRQVLDGEGHLVLYPGTGAETYKMAYNSTSTIAGLQTVLTRLLVLPEKYLSSEKRKHWEAMLKTIPPIAFREKEGHKTISPAWTWARINNLEIPQLYPVYPWGMYGIGRPDLEVAINTWKYGTDLPIQKNHISWHQDAIFCARLGLTDEAAAISLKKLQVSERRFPTFWGPGHDWVPDHNWGGSGMIGLQEMLMQTVDKKIYLFPAWPKNWDVSFKLHAPYQTTVEGSLKEGKVVWLKVMPETRKNDIEIMKFKQLQNEK